MLTRILLLVLVLAPGSLAQDAQAQSVRFATFNASLNRDAPGKLVEDLATPDDPQAKKVAQVIQIVRPDVLLINEFDYDDKHDAARLFQTNYLSIAQGGREPIEYPFVYVVPSNTGVASGFDLNNDGKLSGAVGTRDYGNDALGFGTFPGQYAFVIYSRFPILHGRIRTKQHVLWKDLPDAMLPTNADGSAWFAPEELAVVRLSSKNHVDVPIEIGATVVRVLAAHPTPPAFDGPEDRNGRRNHDELRLLASMIDEAPEPVIIMGDLNADPNDGGSVAGAIDHVLKHPRVNASIVPASRGAIEASKRDGGVNASHRSDPAHDTADFGEGRSAPGNLRVDYVLVDRNLEAVDSGVFWPAPGEADADLVDASDHRLVWLDVTISR